MSPQLRCDIVWFISGVQSVTVETRVELRCGTPVTASRVAMGHSAKRSERRKSSVPAAIVTDIRVRVHLYYSEYESESDVASDLLHCFQSVCLYYSDV